MFSRPIVRFGVVRLVILVLVTLAPPALASPVQPELGRVDITAQPEAVTQLFELPSIAAFSMIDDPTVRAGLSFDFDAALGETWTISVPPGLSVFDTNGAP
jgi:hypothetical protein